MKQNLEGLKTEIERHLAEAGLAVFHCHARALDNTRAVFWDCEGHPDFREFIQSAQAAGVKLIVFFEREFSARQIDDAIEQMGDGDFPRDEFRDFERRLKPMRAYDGFVCEVELSFQHEGALFVFDVRTDWYRELREVQAEIDVLTGIDDDEDDTIGGYFSKN